MEQEIKATIELNAKSVIARTKEFGKEFEELCNQYGLAPDVAKDEETGDIFFCVNVKSFITRNDIKMKIEK